MRKLRIAGEASCCRHQRPNFRFCPSVASAFLTSDCEIPNCRAIVEGLTPAATQRPCQVVGRKMLRWLGPDPDPSKLLAPFPSEPIRPISPESTPRTTTT